MELSQTEAMDQSTMSSRRGSSSSFSFFFIFILASLGLSPAQQTESDLTTLYYTSCGGDSVQDMPAFRSNLATLLKELERNSLSYLNYSYSTKSDQEDLQGLSQCRGDLTLDLCNQCVSFISNTTELNACSNTTSFRADAGGCSLLYTSWSDDIASNLDKHLWSKVGNTSSMSLPGFGQARDRLLLAMAFRVPSSADFFAQNDSAFAADASIYALMQCFGILSSSQCSQCTNAATLPSVQDALANATEGIIYYGACFARFSSSPFRWASPGHVPAVSNSSGPPESTSTSRESSLHLAIGLGLGLGSLLVALFIFFYCRFQRKVQIKASGNKKEDGWEERFHEFSIEEIRRATQNFHQGNTLGKGGFGHVYKGTLDNGQNVAIKKLDVISNQAETQFVAEVKFIRSVQHRNLIRLHGYCTDSMERILVYEFLPNQSLDKHIFNGDMKVRKMLTWEKRLNILMGTARGIAYMHHDCHRCIIHRDIKAANILLDESLNPKIADFGLAKLFGTEKTYAKTDGVAGTWGYLAPEYILSAQLTEKADVYSFGILMLEVVSGRKVIINNEDESLLQRAWKLFKTNRVSELVDVALGKECDMEQVTQVVNLALSCTQESSSARPSMNNVVAILGKCSQGIIADHLQSHHQPRSTPEKHISSPSWSSTSSNASDLIWTYPPSSKDMA